VTAELAGQRADRIVARLFEVSRSVARGLVEEGRAVVDGRLVEPSTPLGAGSVIEVERLPTPAPVVAEEVTFQVRYEDEEVAVVDKPAGLVVHPGAGRRSGTLAAGLLHRWPELEGVGEEHRWGLVHRLDKDTSGLLVVARTSRALRALRREMAARRIERLYAALAHGGFPVPTGTIDAPVGRDPSRPTRMAVVREGRPAVTHYQVVAEWDRPAVTLLEVRLESGRTHQIRVHLTSIGHALVGDRNYGRPGPPGVDPGRVWLHAARLRFPHPVTGETVAVSSSLPDDLAASLDVLGRPSRGTTEEAGPGPRSAAR
jgi:23S rRNA pseudouridine1911/1915/1917 synthase